MGDVRYLLMHRKILTATALFYHRQLRGLPKDHQAWQYLRERGITEETADKAKLGFSTGEGLYQHLISEGYLHSIIFAKSLAKSNKDKDLSYVDFFGRGRIIFPLLEEDRVMSLTSRICYQTTNKTIPRYKMLGGNSYTFYSPDFVKPGEPLFVVEGPLDVLVLMQHGYSSCCFLGTSGFKKEYAQRLITQVQNIYCIPDAEHNPQSRKANIHMYIRICESTGRIPAILNIPIGMGGTKIDPADWFFNRTKDDAQSEMKNLMASLTLLHDTREWKDHLRKLQDQRTKEQVHFNTLKEGEKLEKFPIIQTLELLGVKVLHSYGSRPTCVCFNPEHEDSNPSVHIYENTQTFHCFGCSAGHDAIDAVRMVMSLDFTHAIDWLRENINEEHPSRSV
jgi:DNA primase